MPKCMHLYWCVPVAQVSQLPLKSPTLYSSYIFSPFPPASSHTTTEFHLSWQCNTCVLLGQLTQVFTVKCDFCEPKQSFGELPELLSLIVSVKLQFHVFQTFSFWKSQTIRPSFRFIIIFIGSCSERLGVGSAQIWDKVDQCDLPLSQAWHSLLYTLYSGMYVQIQI